MRTTAIATITWLMAQVHYQGSTTQATPAQFGAKKEVQNEEHLKQHLQDKIDVEKMTEEQKRFHYFSIVDLNRDMQLDGLEIIKYVNHYHEEEEGHAPKPMTDQQIETIIDEVMRRFDLNGDGYIDYTEFVAAETRQDS